ncbi:MAG: flagellar hook-associated protein FlgK [Armatimonadetes bacterium]|nr:flagellar hook-associated protein FlgK [Armatimonadota bacterium]
MSFFALDVLRRALQTQQRGMEVTGHNVANVNTPGYTRQEPVITTLPPTGGTLLLGTGNTIPRIRQYRDVFIEQQIRTQGQTLAEQKVRRDMFGQVETIFPEPSPNGLGTLLGQFWNAWQELSLNPESTAARVGLLEEAQTMAAAIRQAYDQMEDLREQLDTVAVGNVQNINDLAEQIAALNTQIARLEVSGQRANDLRDRRGVLLGEMAEMAGVIATENDVGELLVYLQGRQLVGPGGGTTTIETVDGGSGGFTTFQWPDGGTLSVSKGALAANLTGRDTDIPALQAELDDLADGLISEVNALHSAAYTLESPTATGVDFFTGSGASDIDVTAAIKADVRKIAASATGEPGDGAAAVQIAQLRRSKVMEGGTATIDDVYRGMVARVGVEARDAERQVSNQELLLNQLKQRREAASGVSLDEEMTNMLRYQRAYEAAARMVSAVDEMLQILLREMGR